MMNGTGNVNELQLFSPSQSITAGGIKRNGQADGLKQKRSLQNA